MREGQVVSSPIPAAGCTVRCRGGQSGSMWLGGGLPSPMPAISRMGGGLRPVAVQSMVGISDEENFAIEVQAGNTGDVRTSFSAECS